ncbi:DegV family protein [Vagococcus acidifermentans]|uniref:Fatty acid-binding protein DegV n=1 Tax=Vagococcus acidifermentans TaxID=564710 RepID=A0A430B0A0_9ENTE|nr:DegV family protein [Vagococcus acidifermentans]RSU13755.1 fatty acid-binding protein DegV [Vagococcus acidifermentans]
MMKTQIALLVDSGMDVPKSILEKEGTYVIPLQIIYKERTYTDKVDITSAEIYARLGRDIPSTSLPSGEMIEKIIKQIIADGYNELIVGTISSGLSGTHNVLNMMLKDYPQLRSFVLDTKSIGIGGGLQAAYAKELIDSGMPFDDIVPILQKQVARSDVFFSIPTLEYLKKGGRIGLVTSIVGTAFNINPIISCNDDGIYYTVSRARGRRKSIDKMVQIVKETIGTSTSYNMAVAYGNDLEEAKQLAEHVRSTFPNINQFFFDEVSPALGVHTGPGVLGIAVSLLKD